MTEECQNCRKEVEKYVILQIAEFYDTNQDVEAASYKDAQYVRCVGRIYKEKLICIKEDN